MSDPFADRPFPRGALLGAAALIGFTLIAVATARIEAIMMAPTETAAPVESLDVRFADRADGAVLVYDAKDDQLMAVLKPGSNGFVRGALRGLARERKRQGVGAQPAFQLIRWDNGHLSLIDPTTAEEIELDAFGPTNAGAFANLLIAGRSGS